MGPQPVEYCLGFGLSRHLSQSIVTLKLNVQAGPLKLTLNQTTRKSWSPGLRFMASIQQKDNSGMGFDAISQDQGFFGGFIA